MRVLVCTLENEGAWFAWLLQHGGHTVDWTIAKDAEPTFQGILKPPIKRPNPANYDFALFTSTDMGEAADSLSIPSLGDSTVADALEDDRLFGLEIMEKCGIAVPTWEVFNEPGKAIDWLRKNHKRCVLKPNGDVPKDLTYVSKNEADMIGFIEQRLPGSGVKEFVLQEFVSGTEIGTNGWFNGKEWVAMDYTLEEKKLMSGGIGPNTGAAGSLIWMAERKTPLFEQGLGLVSPFLVDVGFRGPIDLNTIVTEGKAYGLEWTPRFGYEGTCNVAKLLPMEFGEFLWKVASGEAMPGLEPRAKYAATIRLGVPPYPNPVKAKWQQPHQPIKGLSAKDLPDFFLFDVNEVDGEWVCTWEGKLGCPIGCSDSIGGAFAECEAAIKRLDVPDLMWRNDVGKCVEKRYATLQAQGWLRQL